MPLAPARGSITLELIIAFAIFSLALASVILLLPQGNAAAFARESDELFLARDTLERAALEPLPQTSAIGSVERNGTAYMVARIVRDITPCAESVEVSAGSAGGKKASLSEIVADADAVGALGGDCEAEAAGAWNPERTDIGIESDATALDALGSYVYAGLAEPPYLAIVDAANDTPFSFENGFALPAKPNDIDTVLVNGKRYIFAALDATTSQLAVVDATDPANPSLAPLHTLAGVDPDGSYPEGYRVRYYDKRVYVATRETAGPELHVFEAEDPQDLRELGAGTEIGSTVNGLAFSQRGGKRYALLAAARDSAELSVYDATDGAVRELSQDRVDLPGGQDGESLSVLGNTLYFGRASNTAGPELYVFSLADLPQAPALLGAGEVGSKNVSGIIASGALVFITATLDALSTRRLEVWNVADTAHPEREASIPLAGLAPVGIDYAQEKLFAAAGGSLFLFKNN